jgi:muramoyltetrapeptide carboxypeptidase
MAEHKIIIPPYLKKGDTIGMVCPAGYMPMEKMKTCIEVLQRDWGFRVKKGKTLGSGVNYFSGTDAERLADIQEMMDDPEVKAVLCARGGYGVGRIIDQIDFRHFRKHPKWLIGFSDITVLHAHIHTRYHIATLHAPMAGAFQDGGFNNEFVQSLRKSLLGKKAVYEAAVHPFNHPGKVSGVLVGGNLALLSHLVGTASDLRTKGKILFVEDVGEQLYNIDRMFYQLKRSGKLDKLAGLVIGGFTDCKDTDRTFGKTAYEIIHDLVKEYTYPVCYGFPVSHEKENYALKVSGTYTLSVSRNKVKLNEII